MDADPRRRTPRTDTVLADPRLVAAGRRLGTDVVKAAVVAAIAAVRRGQAAPESAADLAVAALPPSAGSMRAVLNATGVIVHTNLGRAPLSDVAVEAIRAAAGYVDVELDLATGRRARRGAGAIDALLGAVPDAQAALVVNNGAAALALVAGSLAAGRDIVVSRGELVEIGDGFRLPDLLTSTGARLREVGTTNRTSLDDYAAAVGPDTAFVLKVHPSNFTVRGFTSSVPVTALASLGVDVVVDIGSGLLRRDSLLPAEPDVTTMLREGASMVTASGDKLLGGPQAGLLFGRAELVDVLRRHPLARALRVDKLTLASLEATIRGPLPPVHQALHADADELRARCDVLAAEIAAAGLDVEVVAHAAVVGGGGAPGVELPGWALSLPTRHAEPLRLGATCVVGVVERGRLLLDLRCVPAERDRELLKAVLDS